MFMSGHRFQVFGTIIVPDSVQVMHLPAFRHAFTVRLFPDIDIFTHVAAFVSAVITMPADKKISLIVSASTIPIGIILTPEPIIGSVQMHSFRKRSRTDEFNQRVGAFLKDAT